jgi:hypothetical protein
MVKLGKNMLLYDVAAVLIVVKSLLLVIEGCTDTLNYFNRKGS